MKEATFDPETTECFMHLNEKGAIKGQITYAKIKWNQNQLALFQKLKEIPQPIWIQIYDVYLNSKKQVVGLGLRVSPQGSFYHEYPEIEFDENGWILNNLDAELQYYQNLNLDGYHLLKNFYQVLEEFSIKNKRILH